MASEEGGTGDADGERGARSSEEHQRAAAAAKGRRGGGSGRVTRITWDGVVRGPAAFASDAASSTPEAKRSSGLLARHRSRIAMSSAGTSVLRDVVLEVLALGYSMTRYGIGVLVAS